MSITPNKNNLNIKKHPNTLYNEFKDNLANSIIKGNIDSFLNIMSNTEQR